MVIFITGLSGSGKSTISEIISKSLNIEHIKLDMYTKYLINHNYKSKCTGTILKYINEIPHKDTSSVTWESDPQGFHNDFIKYLMNSKNDYVIEGIQFYWKEGIDRKMIFNNGIIILEAGYFKCLIRRLKRTFKSNKPLITKIKNVFKYDITPDHIRACRLLKDLKKEENKFQKGL